MLLIDDYVLYKFYKFYKYMEKKSRSIEKCNMQRALRAFYGRDRYDTHAVDL